MPSIRRTRIERCTVSPGARPMLAASGRGGAVYSRRPAAAPSCGAHVSHIGQQIGYVRDNGRSAADTPPWCRRSALPVDQLPHATTRPSARRHRDARTRHERPRRSFRSLRLAPGGSAAENAVHASRRSTCEPWLRSGGCRARSSVRSTVRLFVPCVIVWPRPPRLVPVSRRDEGAY